VFRILLVKCMILIELRFRKSLNRGQIWLRGFGIFTTSEPGQ
jgi:hypothetical protein